MCKNLCIFASYLGNAAHWIPPLGNKYVTDKIYSSS
jgi:hypothetical protein